MVDEGAGLLLLLNLPALGSKQKGSGYLSEQEADTGWDF